MSRSIQRRIRLALFILFWGLYLFLGLSLGSTNVFKHGDVIFQADTQRVTEDLTESRAHYHHYYDPKKHPLFVLFFNPAGVVLMKATGSATVAIALLTALFGALCVVMAHAFFQRAGLTSVQAAVYAVILGLSSTHIVFASIPDTFIFAASSLILLCWIAVAHPGSTKHFVPAGIFALGITTTNFIQSVIIYFFSLGERQFSKHIITRLATFVVLALSCAIVLSVVQKVLYPNPNVFFLPQGYREQTKFLAALRRPSDGLLRMAKLSEHFFLYNFVAPKPYVPRLHAHLDASSLSALRPHPHGPPWVTFDVLSVAAFYPLGVAAVFLWATLLLGGVCAFIRFPQNRTPLMSGLLLCMLFNFLLHMLYGDDLFLYSAHWTFLVLAWVALSLRRYQQNFLCNTLLGALAPMLLLNNGYFFYNLVSIYSFYNLVSV